MHARKMNHHSDDNQHSEIKFQSMPNLYVLFMDRNIRGERSLTSKLINSDIEALKLTFSGSNYTNQSFTYFWKKELSRIRT